MSVEKDFEQFVAGFLTARGMTTDRVLPEIRRHDSYGVALRQRKAGASDRVLTMLLERALRE